MTDQNTIVNETDVDAECVRLNSDDIKAIHLYINKVFGGEDAIRDEGLFQSVCRNPYQEVFGQVMYPTPYDKAAKYLYDFSRFQIFIDGNKRAAFSTMLTYLKLNNIRFNMSERKAYDLVMDVVKGKYDDTDSISKVIEAASDSETSTVSSLTPEILENILKEFASRYSKTFRGLAAGENFDEDAFFEGGSK